MPSTILFYDRLDAARQLARIISREIGDREDIGVNLTPIVYGLPCGGLPLAATVALALNCPLDILVAKKITTENNRELAIGAVTAKGTTIWAESRFFARLSLQTLNEALAYALNKAKDLAVEFEPFRSQNLNNLERIAIVVDDGIATGLTIKVAVEELKQENTKEIWICAPVAPADIVSHLQQWADKVILLEAPKSFCSVSRFYQNFPQISLQEAIDFLRDDDRSPQNYYS
jgi:putative phosphoribosyl transferase